MKIGVDLSMVSNQNAGIDYYAIELSKALIQNNPNFDFIIYSHSNNLEKSGFLKDIYGHTNFKFKVIDSNRPNFKWILKVTKDLYLNKVDYFISPSNFAFGFLFNKTVQIVHDLAPILTPEYFPKNSKFKYYWLLKLVTIFGYRIGTISQTTLDDLEKFFKKSNRFKNIGIGINSWTYEKVDLDAQDKVQKKYNLPSEFVLTVGTLQPRKNHINMIKAFKIFKDKTGSSLKYVITGKKGWLFEEIFKVVEELNLENDVNFTGYVEDSDIKEIYDLSTCMMFVSFWEGAGLPPLEAYSRGKISVISKIKVFEEVMKNNAIYADPNNPENIANALMQAINTKFSIDNKFLAKYNWKEVSNNIVNLMLTK